MSKRMSSAGALPPTVIAGAGPAGCAAALSLLRRGRAVVLLDRARFPRDKVCGDVLLPEAIETLATLTELPVPTEAARCVGLSYTGPSGRTFTSAFTDSSGAPRPWRTLRRAAFDAWLLARARRAGAEIHEGAQVLGVVRDAGGRVSGLRVRDGAGREREIAGAAVIGADGAGSAVARAVSPARAAGGRVAVALRGYAEGADLPMDIAEVHATRSTLPGCAWMVPVGPGACNVGAGVVLSDLRGRGVAPPDLFARACAESPALARRLRAARITALRGWSLPLMGYRRRLAGAGWLLVGDAAGLIDPLTGHGIHTALESGRLAGEHLADALEEGDASQAALRSYERAIRRTLRRTALFHRLLQRMQARAGFADLLALAGARSPWAASVLTRLAGHVPPPAPAPRARAGATA